MRRRRNRKKSGGAPKWMVTYSDMVTLILVFFILLFSMSQIDLVKFQAVSESFRNRMIFDSFPSPIPMEHPTENSSHLKSGQQSNEFKKPTQLPDINDKDKEDEREHETKDSLHTLMEDVESFLTEHKLTNVISASRTERGVVLVLQERILFDSGEANILKSGKPFLNKIGDLLTNIPNHVKVEGHTDNRPISNYRYPSNWELSGARAGSVIRYLIQENDLDESRFSIAGYGDTRPLVPNTSAKNWSQNRRVEIVILEEHVND